MKSPAYWGVTKIPFLQTGKFTTEKRDAAIEWCKNNCIDKFISSDIFPWAFLSKKDADNFQKQFGGEVKYKEAE